MMEADERMYRNIIDSLIHALNEGNGSFPAAKFQIGSHAAEMIAEGRISRVLHMTEPALSHLFYEYLSDEDRLDLYLSDETDVRLSSYREAFAQRVAEDDGAFLKERLPQLITVIRNGCARYDASVAELVARMDAAYEEICTNLMEGNAFREVTAITPDSGDVHNRGRATAVITTDAGKIVYKPHDVGIDVFSGKLIGRFFADIMRAPRVCAFEDHGFAEFIENHPADTEESARKYFHNLGGLAAAVLMLGSSDLHHTNVLSEGTCPVIIDYELMMTPGRGIRNEGYRRELAESLLYSSLMPSRHGDTESSILFAADADNPGAPVVDGIRRTVLDYPDAFLAGFRSCYRRCMEQKEELKRALRSAGPAAVRHILRGTDAYTILLEKLGSPAWLKDPERGNALRKELGRAMLRSGALDGERVIQSECDALLEGDIPYFYMRADSRDLYADGHVVFENYFPQTCLDYSLERIDRMNEADLAFEEALLQKAMTRVIRRIPQTAEITERVSEKKMCSDTDLLSRAEAIFRDIAKDALRTPSGGLCWFGPDYFFRSGMNLLDEGLMTGTAGLAVFFAAVHAVSQDPAVRAQSAVLLGHLLNRQKDRMNELSRAEIIYPNVESPSLSFGLAGKLQACTMIGRMIGMEEIHPLIEQMTAVLQKTDLSQEGLDVYGGLAGLLTVLCAYDELFEQPGIPELCEQTAERIIASPGLLQNDLRLWKTSHAAWPVSGAGHGQSGAAAALYRAGKRLNRDDFCRAAMDGFRFERRIYSDKLGAWPDRRKAEHSTSYLTGYCNGAPGIGLNALHTGYEHADWIIEHAVESVRKEPLQYKDHLCCGNSASVEFLLAAGRILNRPELQEEAMTRMVMVIERAERDGHYHCVNRTLSDVYSPSLFYGTAGIGYEILRLAFPDRIEPVLL